MTELEANLRSVQERLAAAAGRSSRDPAEITLVAVTKSQPLEVIQRAYELGLRNFGENRVEELEAKARRLPHDVTWHMIGHIQSRKAAQVLALAQYVHSVDSLRLAKRLDLFAAARAEPLPVLLQFNISGETSKHGLPGHLWWVNEPERQTLLATISDIVNLPRLSPQGLMTMAPIVTEPEQARPVFASLRRLRAELAADFPQIAWRHLSMGMSDDFEVAIEEGATLVRLGRAIFAPGLPAACALSPTTARED